MPQYSDLGPYVIFSTYESWQEISDWYSNLSKDIYNSNADMKRLIGKFQEKTAGNQIDLAREIYSFVTKKVRYVGIWFGSGKVKPRDAITVYKNLYGDCKDKTTLLITLLREAGFRAWPLLVSSREVSKFFHDFPAMIFNHSIAVVELNGKSVYLDPTVSHGGFNYLPENIQGRYALLIKEKSEFLSLPVESKEANGSKYIFDLNLDDSGGLTGKLTINFFGEAAYSIRSSLYGLKEEESKQRVARVLLSIIPGIKISNFVFKNINETLNPVELQVDFLTNAYFNKVDDLLVIPARLILFKREDLVASKTRNFPLEFWAFWQHEVLFDYKFPANYKIRNKLQNVKIDNSFFSYETVSTDIKKNSIRVKEKFYIKKQSIDPNEYLVFKRDYDEMLLQGKKYLVLQKKK